MKTLLIAGWIAAVLALAGCEGEDDSLAPPKYDLTGIWDMTSPVDCDGSFLTESQWNQVEREMEVSSARVTQTGNTLEIVWLDSGDQITGTISDDQIRYAEDTTLDLFIDVDCNEATEGTILDADLVAWTTTLQCRGRGVSLLAICTGQMERR